MEKIFFIVLYALFQSNLFAMTGDEGNEDCRAHLPNHSVNKIESLSAFSAEMIAKNLLKVKVGERLIWNFNSSEDLDLLLLVLAGNKSLIIDLYQYLEEKLKTEEILFDNMDLQSSRFLMLLSEIAESYIEGERDLLHPIALQESEYFSAFRSPCGRFLNYLCRRDRLKGLTIPSSVMSSLDILSHAVENSFEDLLYAYLEDGSIDFNLPCLRSGRITPLGLSISANAMGSLKTLLLHPQKVNISAETGLGSSPLELAIGKFQLGMVQELIKAGESLSIKKSDVYYGLLWLNERISSGLIRPLTTMTIFLTSQEIYPSNKFKEALVKSVMDGRFRQEDLVDLQKGGVDFSDTYWSVILHQQGIQLEDYKFLLNAPGKVLNLSER